MRSGRHDGTTFLQVFRTGLEPQPVIYGEKVMSVRDGLPKFEDFPKEFGGSGETLPE